MCEVFSSKIKSLHVKRNQSLFISAPEVEPVQDALGRVDEAVEDAHGADGLHRLGVLGGLARQGLEGVGVGDLHAAQAQPEDEAEQG